MALLTPREERRGDDTGVPLIVGLDNSLLRTDSTLESLCVLARRHPVRLLAIPGWLLRGVAYFKQRMNEIVLPDVRTLPYREELQDWLRAQHAEGRVLELATSADQRLAQAIAQHAGLFERVIASDGTINLKADAKRDRLVSEFGHRRFDYVGARRRDYPVWCAARYALLVSNSQRLAGKVARVTPVARVFHRQPTTLRSVLREMRIHHWVKNLLIFVPVAAAHRLMPLDWLGQGVTAFAAFSLGASGVYVLNDLLDLEHDRAHPDKKGRMIASGQIRPKIALIMLGMLIIGAGGLCALLPASFAMLLAAYFLLMTAYSVRLKDVPILDVSILTAGYAMRVVAGALAFDIPVSPWVAAFIALLFLSFALIKRCGELLHQISMSDEASARLCGYRGADAPILIAQGLTSGYLAVLVMALYTNTQIAQRLFPHHEFFWALCALLLYWINYMWFTVMRGRMPHDPVVFALIDPVSRWLFAAMAAVTLVGVL